MQRFIPHFDYHLTDVRTVDDAELLNLADEKLLKSLFLVFKHAGDTQALAHYFSEIFKFLRGDEQLKEYFFPALIAYLYQNSELREEMMVDLGNEIFSQEENTTMVTTAQRLIAQGEIKGEIKGKIEMILNGWQLGLTIEQLMKQANLSKEQVLKIIADAEQN